MRGRKRIFSLVALLSAVLVVSIVFASGIIDVPKLTFMSAPESSTVEPASSSSSITLSVSPSAYLNRSKIAGEKFQFHIDISGPTDMNLFSWQVNVTWKRDSYTNERILNVSRIIPGAFLGAPKDTSSEALGGVVINSTDNAMGYTAFAETVLGNVPGVNGIGPTWALCELESTPP